MRFTHSSLRVDVALSPQLKKIAHPFLVSATLKSLRVVQPLLKVWLGGRLSQVIGQFFFFF